MNQATSPPERGAVNPNAMHDQGKATRERHDPLLHPIMPGYLSTATPKPVGGCLIQSRRKAAPMMDRYG